jgi:dolichol-phosphate mannosyltransferase
MKFGKNSPLVTLSVVTPCYDEQDVLPAFYERVIEVCSKVDSYELVLIDDESTDGTWPIIRSLVRRIRMWSAFVYREDMAISWR